MKKTEIKNSIKKIFLGAGILTMIFGSTAYGFETKKERRAREAETRMVQKQAVNSGRNLISLEEAKSIAFETAGVNEAEVKRLKVRLEQEDDYIPVQYIYEIEFKHDGLEYEFDINGETREILKSEVDSDSFFD